MFAPKELMKGVVMFGYYYLLELLTNPPVPTNFK